MPWRPRCLPAQGIAGAKPQAAANREHFVDFVDFVDILGGEIQQRVRTSPGKTDPGKDGPGVRAGVFLSLARL